MTQESRLASAIMSAERRGHRMTAPTYSAGEERSACTLCGLSIIQRRGEATGLALRTQCRGAELRIGRVRAAP